MSLIKVCPRNLIGVSLKEIYKINWKFAQNGVPSWSEKRPSKINFSVKKINVAIDGYSSCGKSTLAKDLAKSLGYLYIDSGAMYRAVTLYFIQNEVNIESEPEVLAALEHIDIDFSVTPNGKFTLLNGVNVEAEIRKMTVSDRVSEISAIPSIRKKMVEQQKKLAAAKGVVMDGRDIGTVVIKDAELKLFLTAEPDIRAKRRFDELKSANIDTDLEAIKTNLLSRDKIDSTREDSPLMQAPDAILLDNSYMSREEQHSFVLHLIKKKLLD